MCAFIAVLTFQYRWCDLGDSSRLLIADAYGRLAILSMIDLHLKEKDTGYLLIHPLGEVRHKISYVGSYISLMQIIDNHSVNYNPS
jgi:hypothetical protein